MPGTDNIWFLAALFMSVFPTKYKALCFTVTSVILDHIKPCVSWFKLFIVWSNLENPMMQEHAWNKNLHDLEYN